MLVGVLLELDDIDVRRTHDAVASALFGRSAPPLRIGRYEVQRGLGEGAMGRVYAAYDPVLRRRVALKCIRAHADPALARRRLEHLRQEARALAAVSHDNVVGVLDVGMHEGRLFVAMELVDGVALDRWLAERRPNVAAILDVLVQAGLGLAAAHDRAIVHRDFKPSNVLVTHSGRVKVADFGLAAPPHAALDMPSEIVGTPAYMAPEQRHGAPFDARADQYAFCVVLYEALHGHRPARTGRATHDTTARIPARISRALDRGLAADCGRRFGDMHSLLAELARARRSLEGRRRWRWAVAPLGLAMAIGIARQHDDDVCARASDSFEAIWDATARARVQAAVIGSGAAYASDVWQRLAPILDAYAAAGVEATQQACRPSGIDGSVLAERRLACLAERHRAFAGAVELFASVDTELVARATDTAMQLPSIEACLDTALLQRDDRHLDRRRANELAARRAELASARVLIAAGRHEEARVALEELRARPSADAESIAAELAIVDAALLDAMGDYQAAARRIGEAHLAATMAGRDDLALEASVGAVFLVGYRLVRVEEGEHWARVASALLDRTGRGGESIGADLRHNVGVLAYRAGDYERAASELSEVLAWRERELDPGDLRTAKSATSLGLVEQQLGRLAPAQAHHERALRISETSGGPWHPLVAEHLVNLATVRNARGDHAGALRDIERATAIQERSIGRRHPKYGLTLVALAMTLRELGRRPEALVAIREGLAIRIASEGEDHPAVAGTLTNLAIIEDESGLREEAIADYERAIAILRRAHGEQHHEVAQVLQNQAIALANVGRTEDARVRLAAALEIYGATLAPDHPLLLGALGTYANFLGQLGREAEAIAILERALAAGERRLGREHRDLAYTSIMLAELRLKVGEAESALGAYARAHAILEATVGADHPDLLFSLSGIASAELALGRPQRAVGPAERAANLAHRPATPVETRRQADLLLAEALCASRHDVTRGRELARAAVAEGTAGADEVLERCGTRRSPR